MFPGKKLVPRIPLPARFQILAGLDVSDMKSALEQFNFRLGLVVPIAASPAPRVARRHGFRNDDDASPLPFDLVPDAIAFVGRRMGGFEREILFLHQEVVPVKPMPQGLFTLESQGVRFLCQARACQAADAGDNSGPENQWWSDVHNITPDHPLADNPCALSPKAGMNSFLDCQPSLAHFPAWPKHRKAAFHAILFVASSGLTRANRVQRFALVRSLRQPGRQSHPRFRGWR